MTSKAQSLLLVSLALSGAACGNYSNEDLEFMNALPEQDALEVKMPSRSALPEAAELARTTHDTTRGLNTLTATLIGLVDLIRSYPPTSRTHDARVWGPFGPGPRDTTNLDWQRRMTMWRDMLTPNVFNFEIAVHKIGTDDLAWPVLVQGSFDAGNKAGAGGGHVEVILADVRAAGFDASDWNNLDHLEIDYRKPRPTTDGDPIHIAMTVTNLDDNPADTIPAPTFTYDYRATDDGQGQMTFDVFANFVPVPPPLVDQMEHVNITSLWLPSGEGRSQMTVVSGDGAGLQQTECWNALFRPTFNVKPWAPGEQTDASIPESVCAVIPTLSAPAF